MNITPNQIATRALRLIGVTEPGETPTPEELKDAYDTLQEMIDNWRTDSLVVIIRERVEVPIVAGKGLPDNPYTIGVGGDINRQRPTWIRDASIISNSNPAQPLELPIHVMTLQEWQELPVKNTSSSIPMAIYYDQSYGSTGLANIYLWTLGNVTANKLVIYCPTSLGQFTSQTQVVDMPPGFIKALRWNLAVECAPEYDREPSATVTRKAQEALGDIRVAGIRPTITTVDRALVNPNGGYYNWRDDSTQ